jgi:hypothetical protein
LHSFKNREQDYKVSDVSIRIGQKGPDPFGSGFITPVSLLDVSVHCFLNLNKGKEYYKSADFLLYLVALVRPGGAAMAACTECSQ